MPDVSIAKAALGYELPGPVSVGRLLFWAQPQLLFLLAVLVSGKVQEFYPLSSGDTVAATSNPNASAARSRRRE